MNTNDDLYLKNCFTEVEEGKINSKFNKTTMKLLCPIPFPSWEVLILSTSIVVPPDPPIHQDDEGEYFKQQWNVLIQKIINSVWIVKET